MKDSETAPPPPPEVHARVFVETPEQIQFTFELAGAGARMMAYLIDFTIRVAAALLVGLIILLATGWAAPGFASGLVLVVMFLLEWGYHTLIEWLWNGYTPGKRLLGIRVVRTNGVAIDLVRSAMRNLLRAADFFPAAYASGLAVMFFTGTQRRLGDLAADVMVIREQPVRLRDLPPLPKDAIALPPDAIEALRLDEKALSLIDEFFRRRQLFSADRGDELALILAAPLATRLGLRDVAPIPLLAGIILAGHERRSSMFGRISGSPPTTRKAQRRVLGRRSTPPPPKEPVP